MLDVTASLTGSSPSYWIRLMSVIKELRSVENNGRCLPLVSGWRRVSRPKPGCGPKLAQEKDGGGDVGVVKEAGDEASDNEGEGGPSAREPHAGVGDGVARNLTEGEQSDVYINISSKAGSVKGEFVVDHRDQLRKTFSRRQTMRVFLIRSSIVLLFIFFFIEMQNKYCFG